MIVALTPSCGGGGSGPTEARASAPTATVSATPSPNETASPSPTKTESPSPAEQPLSGRDRRYVRELGNAGLRQFASEQEAVAAGVELCVTLEQALDAGGSVNVELAPSFTELRVDGLTVSIEVYIAAIHVYCPEFDFLIQEFPA